MLDVGRPLTGQSCWLLWLKPKGAVTRWSKQGVHECFRERGRNFTRAQMSKMQTKHSSRCRIHQSHTSTAEGCCYKYFFRTHIQVTLDHVHCSTVGKIDEIAVEPVVHNVCMGRHAYCCFQNVNNAESNLATQKLSIIFTRIHNNSTLIFITFKCSNS